MRKASITEKSSLSVLSPVFQNIKSQAMVGVFVKTQKQGFLSLSPDKGTSGCINLTSHSPAVKGVRQSCGRSDFCSCLAKGEELPTTSQ